MSACFYAGSFDPPTLGHLDVISRASRLFDRVVVAVMINAEKRCAFSRDQRLAMLEKIAAAFPNVTVLADDGLTIDAAKRAGADVLLRGARSADYAYEAQIASANRTIGGMDTLCLFTAPQYDFISSSIVRDVARHAGDVSAMVPAAIIDDILKGLR